MLCILVANPLPPYNLRQVNPAYDAPLFDGWTEEAVIAHVVDRNKAVGLISVGVNFHVVDTATLPHSSFFDAWEWRHNRSQVDMDKARSIHLSRITAALDAELARLDGDVQRQELRDLVDAFDLDIYTDPGDLHAAWPTALPRPL